MAVNKLLVRSYATNVYLTGGNSFANIKATRPDYVEPVMQYAADNFYIDDVDYSLVRGFITAEEHADTLALKDAKDPQNRPPYVLMSEEVQTVAE